MKLSTFCVLLASALMLMSSLIAGFLKTERTTPGEAVAASAGEITEAEEYLLAVNGQAVRRFGAEYSEALGQWTQNEELTVAAEENAGRIEACGHLCIEAIEQAADGVCVRMKAGEAEISVWPVTGVRVFVGSRLKAGDVIAEAGEYLFISAWTDGRAENPARFVKLTDR